MFALINRNGVSTANEIGDLPVFEFEAPYVVVDGSDPLAVPIRFQYDTGVTERIFQDTAGDFFGNTS